MDRPHWAQDDTTGEEWIDYDLDGKGHRGARRYKNEARLPVLFWETDVVSTFVPFADGYSSYGRLRLVNFEFVSIPRADAILKYTSSMGEFEHWGNYPTGWENPLAHSVSVPSGAGWNISRKADLKFTMLKNPVKPVVVAALIEQKERPPQPVSPDVATW